LVSGRSDRARDLLASARSDGSGGSRTARFAATMVGAVIGAWLGFNVTSAAFGIVAPLLAIFGATAGANLIVLGLDISWDRQVRDRFVETNAKETLKVRPSTG
jgi:hypothetical protein